MLTAPLQQYRCAPGLHCTYVGQSMLLGGVGQCKLNFLKKSQTINDSLSSPAVECTDGSCEENFYCHAQDGCIAYKKENESCQINIIEEVQYRCEPGFVCSQRKNTLGGAPGICTLPSKSLSPVYNSSKCSSINCDFVTHYCTENICVMKGLEGSKCSLKAPCMKGLKCTSEICKKIHLECKNVPQLSTGESCALKLMLSGPKGLSIEQFCEKHGEECCETRQNAKCPNNQIYTTCGSFCPKRCGERNHGTSCSLRCFVGCQCPPGLILDPQTNTCVKSCSGERKIDIQISPHGKEMVYRVTNSKGGKIFYLITEIVKQSVSIENIRKGDIGLCGGQIVVKDSSYHSMPLCEAHVKNKMLEVWIAFQEEGSLELEKVEEPISFETSVHSSQRLKKIDHQPSRKQSWWSIFMPFIASFGAAFALFIIIFYIASQQRQKLQQIELDEGLIQGAEDLREFSDSHTIHI